MKYYTLTKEEKGILKNFENRQLKRIKNITQAKTRYQTYAKATLSKLRNINIRVSQRDLQKVKARAAEKGIPYQTLLASLIHQFSDDKVQI